MPKSPDKELMKRRHTLKPPETKPVILKKPVVVSKPVVNLKPVALKNP
jgi:hypothetical protein